LLGYYPEWLVICQKLYHTSWRIASNWWELQKVRENPIRPVWVDSGPFGFYMNGVYILSPTDCLQTLADVTKVP